MTGEQKNQRYSTQFAIDARSVCKNYGSGKGVTHALTDISFQLDAGKSLAIVGKSGSGKSTLMHILAGLDKPTSGDVVVGGSDLSHLSEQQLDSFRSSQVGFIFQSFYLQPQRTVLENVAVPLEVQGVAQKERNERSRAVLDRLGLLDLENQKAGTLSGGQKQRVVIARAAVTEPQIIFADEPTGNLDSETGAMVVGLLKEQVAAGRVVVLVTHDMELASQFENRLVLADGRVIKKHGKGLL